MTRRGERQFIASLPGEPLAEPCLPLDANQRRAWDDIIAACPDVLGESDAVFMDACATTLSLWRTGSLIDPTWPRELYRMFGHLFMPMHERRRLLFPDRPKRRLMQ